MNQNRIDPGRGDGKRRFSGALADIGHTPASLDEALRDLDKDHEYLLRGGVFTEDVIRYWIKYKMDCEVAPLRTRPHPYEFCLYFDI
jgi:glutamine synthetase